MTIISNIAQNLMDQGFVAADDIRGCTGVEIAALEEAQRVESTPAAYREFMEYTGKNPYWLRREGEWNYEWVLEAKDIAREIVVDDYGRDFSDFEDSFVFQTHQGYMFYYFTPECLTEVDPRFWIFEGKKPVRISKLSFNQWLNKLAEHLPEAVRVHKKLYGGQ